MFKKKIFCKDKVSKPTRMIDPPTKRRKNKNWSTGEEKK